jgi:hypothetical protein
MPFKQNCQFMFSQGLRGCAGLPFARQLPFETLDCVFKDFDPLSRHRRYGVAS